MKKLLMPIFGGILLTSSIGLSTVQNASVVVKQEKEQKSKNQAFLDQGYAINKQSSITKVEVNKVKTASKTWNNNEIDKVLTHALEYKKGKLTINKDKLDITNLPAEVLQHIKLSLDNLNNTVSAGFIKVKIINNVVKLIYPKTNNKNNMLLKSDNEIVEFGKINLENKNLLIIGPGVWASTYGPSHWWRFWEWGAYIHFTNDFTNTVFKWAKITCELISIGFLLVNIIRIDKAVSLLSNAIKMQNTSAINKSMTELSEVLGNVNLDFIGKASEVLATILAIVALGYAIQTATTAVSAGVIEAAITLLLTGIIWISDSALSANRGYGVKWQWANFIIPLGFVSE